MVAFVSKNLTFLTFKHTSPVYRSLISFSHSLHFFSTSRESQPCITPKVFDILLHRHNFPPELASRVASELTRLKNPEKVDLLLSFFKECGFSTTQIEKILKYRPRFLMASLEDSIKPKIKILQDTGFSSNDISRIISSNPSVLHRSVKNNIIPSLSLLEDLLGSFIEVAKVLRMFSMLLTINLKNRVVPNVEFLKSCGIPMERIHSGFRCRPRAFMVKPEIMRKCAQKIKEMGLDESSKMFVYAIGTIAPVSNEAWELKLKGFQDLGFSESDILKMFRKDPATFSVSMEKIKKIKEILLATGKFKLSCIANSPRSLAFSIEKRYIPRLQILGILESRNLIKHWPALSAVSKLPDDEFFKRFISPHLNEISDVYITMSLPRAKGR